MFERFTEQARRALFFARYDCSILGSISIDPEHLLLGLLRVAVEFTDLVPAATATAIREQLLDEATRGEPIPTSVEIPFSKDAKSVLETAAREADVFLHGHIGTEHLLVALALTPGTDRVLAAHGVGAGPLREQIKQRPQPPGSPPPMFPARTATPEARQHAGVRQLEATVVMVRSIGEQHADVPGAPDLVERACRDLEALKALIAAGT